MAGRRRPDDRQCPDLSRPQSVYWTPRRAGRPDRGGSAMNIVDAHRDKPLLSEADCQVRVDRAACYRLVAMNGWVDVLAPQLSARRSLQATGIRANTVGRTLVKINA